MSLRIITTGGTIDKIYFDEKSEFEVGDPLVDRVLEEAHAGIEYEIEHLMRKDSLDMSDDDRQAIREAVERASENHIVITHGTDSMVDTGKALAGIKDKVVVLTGALSPVRFRTSDATFNIGMAVAAVQSLENGVYIAMNGTIFDASRVRKNREKNRFEKI